MKVSIAPAERLDCIKEYYFSRKNKEIAQLRAQGRDIIQLGIGSPDLPPDPKVIKRLSVEAARPDTHAYQPYIGAKVLRQAFAQWYERAYGVSLNPDAEILPLVGSKEGIMHICMTFLNKGDKVLIPNPGYPTYRAAATIAGGECVEYLLKAENGYMPDFDALEAQGLSDVKIMIVNYPHMPTGTRPTRQLFERLVEFALRNNILLVHDNPYSFVRNDEPMSLLAVDGAMDAALELNSLSKGHCMAGWRIGVLTGRKEWIDEVLRFKSNMDSGMFYPLQAAAAEALALGDEWFSALNATYRQRQDKAYELLEALGCTFTHTQAGLFVWASMPADFKGDCFAFSDKVPTSTRSKPRV